MAVTERQQQLLRELGIEVWRLRSQSEPAVLTQTVADSSAVEGGILPATKQADSVGLLTLESLQAEVAQCKRCGLHQTRSQTVFGAGDSQVDWMFVGDAPGAQEDQQGEPFVGEAGALLTKMIAALNLERDAVYLANVVKCREPNDRNPLAEAVASCKSYLQQQIELISPKVIVAFGEVAGQALLQCEQTLEQMRAQLHRIGANDTPLVVTYHPSHLLHTPADKRKAWEDLKLAQSSVESA